MNSTKTLVVLLALFFSPFSQAQTNLNGKAFEHYRATCRFHYSTVDRPPVTLSLSSDLEAAPYYDMSGKKIVGIFYRGDSGDFVTEYAADDVVVSSAPLTSKSRFAFRIEFDPQHPETPVRELVLYENYEKFTAGRSAGTSFNKTVLPNLGLSANGRINVPHLTLMPQIGTGYVEERTRDGRYTVELLGCSISTK